MKMFSDAFRSFWVCPVVGEVYDKYGVNPHAYRAPKEKRLQVYCVSNINCQYILEKAESLFTFTTLALNTESVPVSPLLEWFSWVTTAL